MPETGQAFAKAPGISTGRLFFGSPSKEEKMIPIWIWLAGLTLWVWLLHLKVKGLRLYLNELAGEVRQPRG